MTSSPRVLMVVTSNSQLADTGRSTGLWVEELAAPYQVFQKEGFAIDIASPKGGRPPFDDFSLGEEYVTPAVRSFLDNPDNSALLDAVERLQDVAERPYDGVFVVGGFGVMWDLVGDAHLLAVLSRTADAGLPLAAVCHAPAVLADVRLGDGTPLIRDRTVTGFSDDEENAVNLGVHYTRTVEQALRAAGATYSKNDSVFVPHVVHDGRLHTGQNPASSEALALEFAQDVRS
ncbi:type 1 glutamine amidotransferase domain-containing protein [Streptomyces sp. GbtcB6]|uniref:type 1 glutamine amidotransferase domain-containing protein n=1 Tax=Streptomyces sp. GbtcB6 TaxID=2824751 RepID=UPI001C301C45|nr:type 1 glutamine amidotransferase domain-containing protein [Streptomyces sp. GbtcB6]